MHASLLLVAGSVLACAACAGAMYIQAGKRRGDFAAPLALAGFAYWGVCQLTYHLLPDAADAVWVARAATPGWIFLGPLCLQIFIDASGPPEPWMRRAGWGLTAVSAAGAVIALTTPWVIADLRPASWGRGIAPGPLFAVASGANVIGAALGVWIGRRGKTRLSEAERRQRRWISLAIAVPLGAISVTDVVLPICGVLFPSLAPAAFGPLAVLALWLRVRIGHSALEAAEVANEILFRSARLAAVGELAAGIAHEINNPLAFVRSNLSQLEDIWKQVRPREAADAENAQLVRDVDELIEESIEGVDRAAEIVRSVKSFAHAGTATREPTDLRPLLEDVLHVASAQLRSRVNVLREFDEAVAPVVCAPQQLRQVFLNLVVNAAQAVEDGGNVLVATRSDGDHVIVSVADDGCGIPPELLDRIFDPFFTTKPIGEGTGLGLGIVHQIVASHGGQVEVESTPGHGSVFRVRLPAAPRD